MKTSLSCCLLLGLLPTWSLASGVKLSEVMYHPRDGLLEFIEVHNDSGAATNLGGWSFSDGVDFTFPAGTVLEGGARLVVCRDRAAFSAAYGLEDGVHGNYAGALDNAGERIALRDALGRIVDSLTYDDTLPFDPLADGRGPSLERLCFTTGASSPGNWRASVDDGGTPLHPNSHFLCPAPLDPVFSPVVINEIHYHPADAGSDAEFVELFNRSAAAVDLEGWQFTDGIEFRFDRTRGRVEIPPRGFLLVAREPQTVAARTGLPVGEIAGPYAGKLSNFGERLELVDAQGVERDVIEYSQDGCWPALADGLGASLQRVSVEASGHLPQNWQVAFDPGATLAACLFFEDGSAVRWFENPDGLDPGFTGAEPWFHPDFDDVANGWRDGLLAVGYDVNNRAAQGWIHTDASPIAGLHSILVRIEFHHDPESDGCPFAVPSLFMDWDDGFVAWLNGVEVARGGMQEPPGTVPPFDGSYRAEVVNSPGDEQPLAAYRKVWSGDTGSLRAGRNVLAIGNYNANSRSSDLYSTARLILGRGGIDDELTPAMQNAVPSLSVPPLVTFLDRHPGEPTPDDPVVLTARVAGHDVDAVEVIFDRGRGDETLSMRDDGLGADAVAADGTYSAELPPAPDLTVVRFRIEARNSGGDFTSYPREGNPVSRAGYYVVSEAPAVAADVAVYHMLWSGDLSCQAGNWRAGATFVAGGTAYLGVRFKKRGDTSCGRLKSGLRIDFNKGDLFEGAKDLNLLAAWEDKSLLREKLAWDLFAAAGHPSCRARHAVVHGEGNRFHGLYVALEDPSTAYLRRNGLRSSDALWKCRNALRDGSTGGFEKRSAEEDAADEIELAVFASTLNSLRGEDLVDFVLDNVDVDGLLDYHAVKALISDEDGFTKNWLLFHGTEDDGEGGVRHRWAAHPWDLDLSFGQINLADDSLHADKHPLMGTRDHPRGSGWNGLIEAVLGREAGDYFVKALYGRLRSLLDEKFHPGVLDARIDHLDAATAELARRDLEAWPRWGTERGNPDFHRDRLREYVASRAAFLDEFLGAANDTVREPGGGAWRRFEYRRPPRMKITEIHYHPDGSQQLEFVEIRNLEPEAVDLSGWSLSAVGYDFPPGAEAPAGGFFIVTPLTPAVFSQTYAHDEGVAVFGPCPGQLKNGGEELRLRDSGHYMGREFYPETIDVVKYDDEPPWPTAPDGDGRSLELRDLSLDNDRGESWQASPLTGGSPGSLTRTNAPPVARLDISRTAGLAPLAVTFDAGASFDPEGDDFTVGWSFEPEAVGVGLRVEHVYETPGVFAGAVALDDGIAPVVVEHFTITVFQGPTEVLFRRGDANGDGGVDLVDALRLLLGLFAGRDLDCRRGAPPAEPFASCGVDATLDTLECERYEACR